jgi:hypothetical protein
MTIITDPAAETLPGKTEHETADYRRDHGHHIAAAEAYRYMWRLLESNPGFPLPPSAETVIAEAHDAMQAVHVRRQADHEAYAARRLGALYASLDEYRAVRDAES